MVIAVSHTIVPLNVTINIALGRKKAGVAVIGSLIQRFYRPILEQAKKDRIPILDLSNTFNPFDGDLYISGIEPSKQGGALIAEGIAHIVRHHQYDGKSKIYAKLSPDGEYEGKDNLGGAAWQVAYPEVNPSK